MFKKFSCCNHVDPLLYIFIMKLIFGIKITSITVIEKKKIIMYNTGIQNKATQQTI